MNSMKYSIWINWDINLIKELDIFIKKEKIDKWNIEFFTWLYESGYALIRYNDKYKSKKIFENNIRLILDLGYNFNYLMNWLVPNMDKDYLLNHLNYIYNLWIRTITVSTEELFIFINENFYWKFNIVASILLHTKTLEQLFFLKRYNIKRVVFNNDVNKNFYLFFLLKKFCKQNNIETELLANDLCIQDCPKKEDHYKICWTEDETFDCPLDWNPLKEIINWTVIRPEDIIIYEKMWLDYIKIAWRIYETDDFINEIKWYLIWKYEWNFFNLIDAEQKWNRWIFLDNSKLNGLLLWKYFKYIKK